jgi:hypothetical protein
MSIVNAVVKQYMRQRWGSWWLRAADTLPRTNDEPQTT